MGRVDQRRTEASNDDATRAGVRVETVAVDGYTTVKGQLVSTAAADTSSIAGRVRQRFAGTSG
jgi:hypothetical protein